MRRGPQIVLGFVLVGTTITGVATAAWATASWYSSLDRDTAVAVLGVVGIALVPIITFLSNRVLERRRAVESATRVKRVELYESFGSSS